MIAERAADAVIRDARVRALQVVPDADVTEHVVRQRPQQPHRAHCGAELAAEGGETAVGSREQRKKVVLVLVGPATRADIDAGGVVEARPGLRIECVAMRDQPGRLDRLAGGVDAEHVGTPDELEQLPVVEQRTRIEVGDLGRDPHRPARSVPLPDRRDRRPAGANRRKDLGRRLACAADRARSGDDDALHSVGPSAARGRPSVDLLRVAQDDAAVRSAEAERVGHRDPDASPRVTRRARRQRRSPGRARPGSR